MKFKFAALFIMLCSGNVLADTIVPMHLIDGNGEGAAIGQISISDSKYGLVLTPSLKGLPAGLHGFHLHENPSCDAREKDGKMVPGLAAGGHYDMTGAKHHGSSWGDGHIGDLPALFADAEGNANQPVLAPRLKVADIIGRSLMIHAGGDNYADQPAPLGGGGARIACGVIK